MREFLVFASGWFAATCLLTAAEPRSMQFIESGCVVMGDASVSSYSDETPQHDVGTSPFYIENLEVTVALWESVRSWAATNGYSDLPAAIYTMSTNEPAGGVSWLDALKWCNARSEMEGLNPIYYGHADSNDCVRSGTVAPALIERIYPLSDSGYRLPVEVEYEKAARGKHVGCFYPWESLGGSFADHIASTNAAYELAAPVDVGSYSTNNYHLYDMAGSIAEWCWDVFDEDYYSAYPTNAWPVNSSGPAWSADLPMRVTRGGSWNSNAADLRCSFRGARLSDQRYAGQGLRCVRDYLATEMNDPDLDSDEDGMPDWWERQYFSGDPVGAESVDDEDKDDQSNYNEYVAGTQPHDSASCLYLMLEDPVSVVNETELSWSSVAGRSYRLYWSADHGGTYSSISAWITANAPVNTYTDAVHSVDLQGFYKVEVRRD